MACAEAPDVLTECDSGDSPNWSLDSKFYNLNRFIIWTDSIHQHASAKHVEPLPRSFSIVIRNCPAVELSIQLLAIFVGL